MRSRKRKEKKRKEKKRKEKVSLQKKQLHMFQHPEEPNGSMTDTFKFRKDIIQKKVLHAGGYLCLDFHVAVAAPFLSTRNRGLEL